MWAPRAVAAAVRPSSLRPALMMRPLRIGGCPGSSLRYHAAPGRAASTEAAAAAAASTGSPPVATAATAVLRHLQLGERRETLPFTELEALCADPKTPVEAGGAGAVAAELHRRGALAHYPGTAAAGTVFLRPQLSSGIVAAALTPAPPPGGKAAAAAEGSVAKALGLDRLGVRLAEIDMRYQPLKRRREALVSAAKVSTTRRMWTYFWAIAGQNVVFIYLIYGPASWDIMEPVTVRPFSASFLPCSLLCFGG